MRCNGIQYLFRAAFNICFVPVTICNSYICLLVFHVKFMTDTEMRLEGKVLDVSKVWFDDKHLEGILGLLYIILLGPK
jgi:hypothetical protein